MTEWKAESHCIWIQDIDSHRKELQPPLWKIGVSGIEVDEVDVKCEKFRDYSFYAPHFTVYTDNNPLAYIMSKAKLNAAGHRWVRELADFRFSIKYR